MRAIKLGGGRTLYTQNESPGKESESSRLPSLKGAWSSFGYTGRKMEALSGERILSNHQKGR